MDTVNAWTGVILGVAAVVATGAAALRWLVATLTRQMRIVAHEVVAEAIEASERRLTACFEQRFDGIEQRFDGIDGRFERIDRRLDAMDRRFDAIDDRFDAMDRRFDALEAKVDHGTEVTDLRLSHLEADMTLVKQHLLGSSAA